MIDNMKVLHSEAGAKIENDRVQYYTDIETEYKTVSEKVGLIDLSHRGKLLLKGKDRFNYLQGLITNDITNCQVGKGVYATLLNVKGKMLYDMYLYKDKEEILLECNKDQAEPLKEHLLKMKFMSEIEIDNLTGEYLLFSLQGPDYNKPIETIFDQNLNDFDELQFITSDFDNSKVYLIKHKRSNQGGVDIYIEKKAGEALWQKLSTEINNLGGCLFGEKVLDILRIEAGIPIFGQDLTEAHNPIEAGLEERAVHFNKGCYTGQEAVARMKYRGHSNWFFKGLLFEGADVDQLKDTITIGDKDIAKITSAVYSPGMQKSIALTFIRKEYIEPDTEVPVTVNGKEISAKVVELPFS